MPVPCPSIADVSHLDKQNKFSLFVSWRHEKNIKYNAIQDVYSCGFGVPQLTYK